MTRLKSLFRTVFAAFMQRRTDVAQRRIEVQLRDHRLTATWLNP
jgi:hypothetical protein